ncbi:MAG: hypothetical protein V1746_01855 [bacterium]
METLFKLGINLAALLFILITLAEWKQKKIDREQQKTAVVVEEQWTTTQLTSPSLSTLNKVGLKWPATQTPVQTQDIRQAYWNLPPEEQQRLKNQLRQNQTARP